MRMTRTSLAFVPVVVLLLVVLAAPLARAAGKKPSANPMLPPSETTAKAALDASSRHGEYVDIPMASGKPIRTWVVYPEMKNKAGVVIVIHEIFGLSDWIRSVADQLARDGFIAVAPDLLSGLGPNGGGTESTASRDDAVALIRNLTPEMTKERLDAVRAYAGKIPAGNGKIGTIGFCWGGGRSFEYAASSPPPQATVVFYGPTPDSAVLSRVGAPVLGLYGGNDERVDAGVPAAQAQLKKLGKPYEVQIYPGAGHGFARAQDDQNGANLAAIKKAWPKAVDFLRRNLK
jgi:carboxymethylenebutenolidase